MVSGGISKRLMEAYYCVSQGLCIVSSETEIDLPPRGIVIGNHMYVVSKNFTKQKQKKRFATSTHLSIPADGNSTVVNSCSNDFSPLDKLERYEAVM